MRATSLRVHILLLVSVNPQIPFVVVGGGLFNLLLLFDCNKRPSNCCHLMNFIIYYTEKLLRFSQAVALDIINANPANFIPVVISHQQHT